MQAHSSLTTLHVERFGNGPDLVLLHGWGMHSGIWPDSVKALRDSYRLHLVDLPGHGQSQSVDGRFDIEALAGIIWQSVAPELHGPAVWLGWSLGGMAAMQIAFDHPQMIRGLALVASTPRFSQADDWPHAMSLQVLEMFAGQLVEDYRGTLQRFLALQVQGSADARQVLRELRGRVLNNVRVDILALQSGLEILKQADLRVGLTAIRDLPVMLVYGERDMLVPVEAVQDIQTAFSNSRKLVFEGAGHAPFISHPKLFVEQLKAFLHATG